jgi:23S rRNA pseudouridine1911/1915/1917 synthase
MKLEVIYEDNHIIAINKKVGDIVQADKTEDEPLSSIVAKFLKKKYNKPGDAFIGVPHRIDRPTSGVVLFAKTSKALTRLNKMFQSKDEIKKTYWAVVQNKPEFESGELKHSLIRDSGKNKTFAKDLNTTAAKKGKIAILEYELISCLKKFFLLEINLKTGRHHQIRSQLAKIGSPIKGDLKYGSPRSNKGGGINLHARKIEFMHPVKKEPISITAPVPKTDEIWREFYNMGIEKVEK